MLRRNLLKLIPSVLLVPAGLAFGNQKEYYEHLEVTKHTFDSLFLTATNEITKDSIALTGYYSYSTEKENVDHFVSEVKKHDPEYKHYKYLYVINYSDRSNYICLLMTKDKHLITKGRPTLGFYSYDKSKFVEVTV